MQRVALAISTAWVLVTISIRRSHASDSTGNGPADMTAPETTTRWQCRYSAVNAGNTAYAFRCAL